MKFLSRVLCGVACSGLLLSTAIAGEGKVVSSADAGGYTYIEVSQSGKNMWIAANEIKVKKGDRIRFSDGAVMTNFRSKTLNRTFAEVMFVNQAAVVPAK